MNNKPYIKLLKTPLGKYFYDVNKNSIVNISEEVYDYLKSDIEDEKPTEKVAEQLEKLKSKGYLSNRRVKVVKHPLTDEAEYHIDNKCSKLVLQITQNCNFRCSYCPYTTSDFYTTRTHSSKRMKEEVAMRAIEFLAEHSRCSEMVSIGFYGGEPLLEFELMKKLVDYADELFIGKRLSYTITTNGSLLTDEIMSFLEEHNFDLMLSIDGTKKAHDRNRKFAANGKGTFDTIEQNLKNVYKTHTDYFLKNVTVNSVIDPRFSANEYYELENKDEMYRAVRMRRTLIDDGNNVTKHGVDDKYTFESNVVQFKALMSLINRYPKEKLNKSIVNNELVAKEMADHYLQPQDMMPEVSAPSGPCVPGNKLFVDVDGVIHLCEKVSETSKAFVLGNIYDGFDYKNVKKLLNIGALTADACKNCFAFNLCTVCQKECSSGDELSDDIKREACRKSKAEAIDMLYTNIFYSELNGLLDREVVLR